MSLKNGSLQFSISSRPVRRLSSWMSKHASVLLILSLSILSVACFFYFWQSGLGLAYNDARSHLDIGRRVVEGLKPGMAQLGSVWLPLPHILMVPTIWNDFMWHSGLSGALVSMISFVITGFTIYKMLEFLQVRMPGRLLGVFIFATNINILYLQSTAMTEQLLLMTMTVAVYFLMKYHKSNSINSLITAAFFIMLATLVRYDGWFLLLAAGGLVAYHAWRQQGIRMAEGVFILFGTLAGLGIVLWLLWNAAIFRDPLYFAFGPYSAHAQQEQLADAGMLLTKGSWFQSIKTYWYAMLYCSGTFTALLGLVGAVVLALDKKRSLAVRLATLLLLVPLVFNIVALYLGHSVLFIQGINGTTWFNVRYGMMMIPSFAVFIGILLDKIPRVQWAVIGLICFVTFFSLVNQDAVTIDDGRVGSSQKNVTEVSQWLQEHAANEPGFVMISAASHDAIIFSSNMPMKRFIHEGTGAYWDSAAAAPDRWATWIIMRTNDLNDSTFKLVSQTDALDKYTLEESLPFADIYQLKPEYRDTVSTEASLPKQK